MQSLRSTMNKFFFPKQDEYTELKTRLRKLGEDLQSLIDRKLVNSSRLLDLRYKYSAILEAKRKLPVQLQKKLQARIDIFLEQYKDYRFEEPIERPKRDSSVNVNIANLEMQSTSYNFRQRSSPDKKQTACQTSFYGKWEKPPKAQVLSNDEVQRTSNSTYSTQNELHASHDVEMKDVSERNQDVDHHVEVSKEVKNNLGSSNRRSSFQEKQKNEDRSLTERVEFENEKPNLRRRSKEGKTGNFQQNEETMRTSSYEVHRKDGHTQATDTAKSNLDEEFKNLKTESIISPDIDMQDQTARKLEDNQHQNREREDRSTDNFCSGKSSLQQKQKRNETFSSLHLGVEYNEHKSRSFQNPGGHYKETHFDTSRQQHLGNTKGMQSASSRIAESVAQNGGVKYPSENSIRCRRSLGDQVHQRSELTSREAAICAQYRHQCEEEMGDVRIQIEENKYSSYQESERLRQEREKVQKFISEDKKSQRYIKETNQRYVHGYQSKNVDFSNGVLVLQKEGVTKIVPQQQPRSVGRAKGDEGVAERHEYQHRRRQSTEQRPEESLSKNCQRENFRQLNNDSGDRQILENKDIKTSRDIHSKEKLVPNRSFSEFTSRNDQKQKFSSDDFQEDHRVEVATEAVENEPLQIVDVHKYFQDDFDLKSLDSSVDATTQIETMKKWAETFEEKVSNFAEAKFSLEYFILDEKLMRFIEHLDKLKCREDKVATQKKIEVIEYIKGLHETLDTRAVDE